MNFLENPNIFIKREETSRAFTVTWNPLFRTPADLRFSAIAFFLSREVSTVRTLRFLITDC